MHNKLVLSGLAWLALALAALAILWPLGLTNRVLAGVDALTYFTPYWAYRMAELRAGHLPLWDPYLFLGVPFLANPQAAVLYPLHWPLSWLSPAQALVWSALLHVWLAAGFTYTFARRSLRLNRPAAWLAGLIFGLGGFTLARVENVNQLNALAWLPALLWLLDETARPADWRRRIRWGTALAVALAMQLLAGHTQTAFINLVGWGLYAVYPVGKLVFGKLVDWYIGKLGAGRPQGPTCRFTNLPILSLLAILPALLLAAAQLLPSLELNNLGLRTTGLPYRQAVSFSLRPRLLLHTFLPPFGGGLAETFGSEGYAEFVGYVGIIGLALAVVGMVSIWRGRQHKTPNPQSPIPNAHGAALILLAAVGLFLALGAYNPFYYLLWRFVPGFALFRAPARWLALYALGMAGLAGVGLDAWLGGAQVARSGDRPQLTMSPCHHVTLRQAQGRLLSRTPHAVRGACHRVTMSRTPHAVRGACHLVIVALALLELWLAARALPFAQATAPAALSLRNAPAALLAATADQPAAGRDRFLSMSDIRYDPGDLAELRGLQSDRLPADAVERFVRAAKQMEVIAPNLSLLLRLPAVDGYDGGMLPLDSYVKLQSLFLPLERLLPDGRLREQLRQIPDGRLLDLTGVRYVITDKQNDLWANDVYYDLEQAAVLQPGEELELDLSAYPAFSATDLGVVSHLSWPAGGGATAAQVLVAGPNGQAGLALLAPHDTAQGEGQPPLGATIARPWPSWMGRTGQDYLAELELDRPLIPNLIRVQAVRSNQAALVIRGLTLIDRRTGTHQAITVSPRGDFRRIHSGDVKVYERVGAPGRAWLVHGVQPVADDAATLALLADPSFNPRAFVAITGEVASRPAGASAPGEKVTILAYEAERVALHTEVATPAMLVLADSFYPGWRATVDGVAAPILRANLTFRAVALEPGVHEVVFTYYPAGWRWGVGVSLGAIVAMVAVLLTTRVAPRRKT
jgi:hypothetical protein